jgi:hypothetical protein
VSSNRPSDAACNKLFCTEAGIVGTTAYFYIWLREQTRCQIPSSSLPFTISETPANNTGKMQVVVLNELFVNNKLECGFNHVQHSADMRAISSETMWAFLTVNDITKKLLESFSYPQSFWGPFDN